MHLQMQMFVLMKLDVKLERLTKLNKDAYKKIKLIFIDFYSKLLIGWLLIYLRMKQY